MISANDMNASMGYNGPQQDPLNKQGLGYSLPGRQPPTAFNPNDPRGRNQGMPQYGPTQQQLPKPQQPQIGPTVPQQEQPSQQPQGQLPQPEKPPPNVNVSTGTGQQQQPNIGQQPPSQQPGGQQPFQPQPLADQLSTFLNNRTFNPQGPAGFQAPQFQPGQNPFVPQQTQNPIMGQGGQAQQFASNMLQNPSRFDNPLVQQSIGLMNQTMDQNQSAQIAANNADASSRGLYYSSVPQGTEGDIRIRTEQGKQQFMNQLLSEQAQTQAQDRSAALQGALGYSGQQQGQDLAQFQAGLQGQGQQFGQALQGYGANLQGQQQGYQQQQQNLQDMLGYQQQNFQNQLSGAQFNQSQDALQQQLMMALLGGT